MYSHQQIKLRAYQLWLDRGQPPDTPEVDWFEAEAEQRNAEPAFARAARKLGSTLGYVVTRVSARELYWLKSFLTRCQLVVRTGLSRAYSSATSVAG
jgi:hypothetical protein